MNLKLRLIKLGVAMSAIAAIAIGLGAPHKF